MQDDKSNGVNQSEKSTSHVIIPAKDAQVSAEVTDLASLRKPDGSKPKGPSELVSVMNAQALAQDNADLRNQVSEMREMQAKTNHVIVSLQRTLQAIQVTIAQTHGATQDTRTRLKAHMRDEHGLPWLGED